VEILPDCHSKIQSNQQTDRRKRGSATLGLSLYLTIAIMLEALGGCLAWSESLELPDWLEISGDLRVRFEAFDGEDFNDNEKDFLFRNEVKGENDEWILTRVRLRVNAYLTERLRTFVELTDARLFEDQFHQSDWPGTQRNWEHNRLDVFQGYVDIKLHAGTHLKVGRQVLKFGSQKFMGSYDWWNTPYTFDAVRLVMVQPSWDLDLFVGQNAVNDDGNFDDTSDSYDGTDYFPQFGTFDDDTIYGLYWKYTGWNETALDLYFFYQDNDNQKTEIPTFGGRLYGILTDPWDYELELMVQPTGEFMDRDHSAWSWSTEVGYTFWEWGGMPRLFAGYDFASGGSGGDSDNHDFVAPYADLYIQLGHQEFFKRMNLHAARVGVQSDLWGKWKGIAELHSFWVDDEEGTWIASYHTFVNATSDRTVDKHVGVELDLNLSSPLDLFGQRVDLLLGYSHFFAGEFIEQTRGVSDDADEAILMLKYYF